MTRNNVNSYSACRSWSDVPLFPLRRFSNDPRIDLLHVHIGVLLRESISFSLGMGIGLWHCLASKCLARLSDFSPTSWTFDIH
jgi:hypothetical protein